MSRFLCLLSKGTHCSSSEGDTGAGNMRYEDGPKEVGFVRAKTGAGFAAEATVLVNGTDKTLYLRDKVGAAYGQTRYKIPSKSHIEVYPLQHTFFTMIAYAVEEMAFPTTEKRTSIDTQLSIDTDHLAYHKSIIITCHNSKFDLEMSPR